MRLGLRLFFAFFAIAGIAAFFVLRVFVAEVKPSVREVMEDMLVDTSNLLAEQAAADLRVMPEGGNLMQSAFALAVQRYANRTVNARIWGLTKETLDVRVYVTDASGRVVFDSVQPGAVGQDYSRWRDVHLTLRGEYGARATRIVQTDERTSVMYVAAPVLHQGRILGVLTVAKPLATIAQFVERAERKILVAGLWLLGLSLAVGVLVTLWLVRAVRRLRAYAQSAGPGQPQAVPQLPGELGDLAQAMGAMRERLEGRHQVEQAMRAMTHELKSPLTAIAASAELLHDELPRSERERFAAQIGTQVDRLRGMVERLLELSRLEGMHGLQQATTLSLLDIARTQLQSHAAVMAQRGIQAQWVAKSEATVRGDAEQLALAVSNLLANAMAHAPDGSTIELSVQPVAGRVELMVRDHGPGVPDYAWPRLGERFFCLPRPRDGEKGSGLGLAIVRQIAALHQGSLAFEPAQPGLRVRLSLPGA